MGSVASSHCVLQALLPSTPPLTLLSPLCMLTSTESVMTTVEQTLVRMSRGMDTPPQEATGLLFLMAEPRWSSITLRETQGIFRMSPMKGLLAMHLLCIMLLLCIMHLLSIMHLLFTMLLLSIMLLSLPTMVLCLVDIVELAKSLTNLSLSHTRESTEAQHSPSFRGWNCFCC